MTTLYVLGAADCVPLARAAARDPGVSVVKRGPYYEVRCDSAFEIDRSAVGCRSAVWFSSVAAIHRGRVARWDKKVLRIEPADD